MKHVGDLMSKLEDLQNKEIPVPTLDIDVKRYLRKLSQPICLFGEDPEDRKSRLRKLLAKGIAANFQAEDNEPQVLPKFQEGKEDVGRIKRFCIDYSIPRAQKRIQSEKEITQERIDNANEEGRRFIGYTTYASELADKRPLTSLSYNGDLFAVGSLSGKVNLWSVSSMDEILELRNHKNRITAVSFLSSELLATAAADMTLNFCTLEGNVVTSFEFPTYIQSLSSHPSGKICITGQLDGFFSIIDVESGKVVSSMKSNDGSVTTLSCHTDGSLVYTGGNDFVGRLWDLRSFTSIKVLQGHDNKISCSTFDDGFHVITGSADNTIIDWDLRNVTRSKKISGHTSTVTSVSVMGDLLLSSSLDCSLKVWSLLDFRNYSIIKECASPVISSSFAQSDDPSKPYIIAISRDGSWRFYRDAFF